jgi:hypothetical protein
MTVTVTIPTWAESRLRECGYTNSQIESIFEQFIHEVVADAYGQAIIDFDNWIESPDFEETMSDLGIKVGYVDEE